ncbi:serine/threonine protein kinase [Streptomyces hirsutus]|uniref:non-specific serine/threonine protein kinase n=1 Tax=Streptomyces hirsutus TaxID=35620 RepID=A0ABZ1GTL9_9ACTN|nr:serine/threonine-protein kinase [Streptomyces hirsutus]WSD08434.1 serine/threonine protein kinase [Streptomyces hirsutus]WTD18106.1 serine/threonine protein kinase [Streptomyces hirsutus]
MQGLLVAGRYRLGDAIGSGGMGRVWRAHDEVLHRTVAVKELTAALYVSDGDQAMMLARTRAEARAAARINHSAVVTVHDVLEHDGRPWIVMELVEGHSLADAVKERERVEPREAARIGLWVLRALRAAHAAGVVHRDVKPGNVLLGGDGRVLLTDFGIAQIEGDTGITRTGEVVGSVDYLAPERIRGLDPGPASDLWALGATLYTAVEGRSPFRRTSPLTTMQAVVEEEADEPPYAGPLAPVISALLRKDPATRPDAEAVEQMLAEAAEGRRPASAQRYVMTQADGTRMPSASPSPSPWSSAYGPGAGAGTGAVPPPSYFPPAAGTEAEPEPGASGALPGNPVTPDAPGAPGATSGLPGGEGSGVTAVQSPSGGVTPAGPRLGRVGLIALVVVLAALVGGGTAMLLVQRGDGRTQDSSSSASPFDKPKPTPTPAPAKTGADDSTQTGGLPAGWVRRDDPFGFSIVLPGDDWERVVFDEETRQVDYTPDGGRSFIRIAADDSPDFDDPYEHLSDLDQQIGQRLVDYRQTGLERRVYRDRESARLEYTWTALAKDTEFPGPYRAVDQMYLSRDGVEYAIYMASPAEDWATTSKQFETVLQGWREPR